MGCSRHSPMSKLEMAIWAQLFLEQRILPWESYWEGLIAVEVSAEGCTILVACFGQG